MAALLDGFLDTGHEAVSIPDLLVVDPYVNAPLPEGVEVLIDDRDERPGVKFKDADLVGIPLRVTIGAKGLEKGCIELRWRHDGKTEEIPVADSAKKLHTILTQALQA